jgi:hypothetical protein
MDKTLNHFGANWRGWGLGARAGPGRSLAPGAQLSQNQFTFCEFPTTHNNQQQPTINNQRQPTINNQHVNLLGIATSENNGLLPNHFYKYNNNQWNSQIKHYYFNITRCRFDHWNR